MPAQVDRERVVEDIERDGLDVGVVPDRVGVERGSVAVQPVDPAERVDRGSDERLDRSLVGDVALDRDRVATRVGDLSRDRLGGGAVDVAHDDASTLLREPDRRRGPDPAGATRDQHHPVRQSAHPAKVGAATKRAQRVRSSPASERSRVGYPGS